MCNYIVTERLDSGPDIGGLRQRYCRGSDCSGLSTNRTCKGGKMDVSRQCFILDWGSTWASDW